MAHRLLPFRQYDENDVVNLYALSTDVNLLTAKPAADGDNADGVVVRVSAGAIGDDVIDVSDVGSTFMNSYGSPVGRNPYPVNPLRVVAAGSGDASSVLGVTLAQTLSIDENNEQLLFNPVKKDELQAVLSGQTVPVLTKGVVTFTADAADGAHPTDAAAGNNLVPGNAVAASASTDGKIVGVSLQKGTNVDGDLGAASARIGSVLATGYRESKTGTDSWAGHYYVCKIDC